jgi:hypothetical protein
LTMRESEFSDDGLMRDTPMLKSSGEHLT